MMRMEEPTVMYPCCDCCGNSCAVNDRHRMPCAKCQGRIFEGPR